uniref:Uncharacterized protein n=1 Tax=Triticum urartu TaxID=4572 RepID=A0A8R7P8J1_TRIUA
MLMLLNNCPSMLLGVWAWYCGDLQLCRIICCLYESVNDIIDFYLLHLKDKSLATHGAAFEVFICILVVIIICAMYDVLDFFCKCWQCGFSVVPAMVVVIE